MESLKKAIFSKFVKNPPVYNLDNVPAKKGKKERFYCGRKILDCSCCDPFCGPDDGCNCHACKWLDIQQTPIESSKLNRAKCRAIFKNGKHYCGRKVLKCSCCKEYCGPDFGCNCDDCKWLDETLSPKENYEGFPAKKGTTGKYYCGRYSLIKCDCCNNNGFCGPISGCNCNSCKWLDDRETGSSTVKANNAGVLASKGQNGLYYCGRKVLTCDCCNGTCEPNGHNCNDCKLLNEQELIDKKLIMKKTAALNDFVGLVLHKEVSIDILKAIAETEDAFVHQFGVDDLGNQKSILKGIHINTDEAGVIFGCKII